MASQTALAAAVGALNRGDREGVIRGALTFLAETPDAADGQFLLGLAGHPHGLTRALALAPDHIGAVFALTQRFDESGQPGAALRVLRRALATAPVHPPILANFALRLDEEDAVRWLRRAVSAAPEDASARLNLGAVLHRAGRPDRATAEHRRAALLEPAMAQAAANVAVMHLFRSDRPAAARWHRRALALDPFLGDALTGLAAVARGDGRPVAARGWDRRALALRPGAPLTVASLNYGDLMAGEAAAALAWARRAEAIDPANAAFGSSVLALMHYLPWSDPSAVLRAHRRWAARHAPPRPRPAPRAGAIAGAGSGRLRIGYLSADLHHHPVGLFVLPLLEAHDPASVHVTCYAASLGEDAVARRLRAASAAWRQVETLDDDAIADLVRADGIDLLIDLAGHTAGNRLGVFARRPAPAQATWLGYYDTSGMTAFDAALADPVEVAPGMETLFAEPVIRLASGRMVYRPPADAPAIADRPGGDEVVLGCFNNPAKIGEATIALWARVLAVLPRSRLVLKGGSYDEAAVRARYLARFAAHGVDPARLSFSGWSPHAAMLAELSALDIVLDPMPFSGLLTSCEALWMGVPVVTLAGRRPVERQTAGLLTRIGLTELIAPDADTYVAIARDLAMDAARRRQIRAGLRARMRASPLCDEPGFARAVEAAYRDIWARVAAS